MIFCLFFFSSRRRHTRCSRDWSSDVCSSDLTGAGRNDLTSFQTTLADLASDNDRIKSDLLAVTTRADETKLEMQKEASRLNGITTEQGQAIQQMRGKIAKLEEIEKRVAALEEKAGKGAARAGAAPQVSGGNFKTPGGV